mmetsp:Transcript_4846/g.8065  ORF Transcript_4846/g.8065 Transcript_4846/m.8065 type:complete len:175 (-) Transcript_4846:233-757(-)
MAQGMWTKRFTSDGSVFYFNSTLNKSEWQPPANATLHAAEKLQIPSKTPSNDAALKEQQKRKAATPEPESESIEKKSQVSSEPSTSLQKPVPQDEEALKNSALAEQLLSSVLPLAVQKPPQQAAKQPRSKRFKTADKEELEAQEESAQAAYHKMVNSYQALAGDNGEGGKWLVR